MPVFRDHPELLLPFREGRREALERVYRTYVKGLDRLLRSLARSNACADMAQPAVIADLLQDIFLRAFSPGARHSYDGVREYGPYIATIARNYFVDVLRTRGREVLRAPEHMTLVVERDAVSDDDNRDPRVCAVLAAYLAGLPPPLKAAYQQRFVLGRSQDEVASTLQITRRTLRTAETHLREGLRRALAKAGISPDELTLARQDLLTEPLVVPSGREI